MTTALLDRVPLDDITTAARQARPGRTALALIGGLLFGLGWIVARSWGMAWLALAWGFTAVRVGWRSARGEPTNLPAMEAVMAENARLRAEMARLDAGFVQRSR